MTPIARISGLKRLAAAPFVPILPSQHRLRHLNAPDTALAADSNSYSP